MRKHYTYEVIHYRNNDIIPNRYTTAMFYDCAELAGELQNMFKIEQHVTDNVWGSSFDQSLNSQISAWLVSLQAETPVFFFQGRFDDNTVAIKITTEKVK